MGTCRFFRISMHDEHSWMCLIACLHDLAQPRSQESRPLGKSLGVDIQCLHKWQAQIFMVLTSSYSRKKASIVSFSAALL
eukprot:tig00020710_g13276.t1